MFWSPPGVPGGGITFSCPPPGGLTCMSWSTPEGGQMTPFESANLSLNDLELPLPMVGGSPLTPGGQVTAFSEGAVLSEGGPPADCATASPPRAIDIAIIKILERKILERKILERTSNPHELAKGPPSGQRSPAGVFRSNVPPCGKQDRGSRPRLLRVAG